VSNSDQFRDCLLSNAIAWLKSKGMLDPEEFLEFQVQEFPVLMDLYYGQGYLVDLYPGGHFDFFFELECQRWATVLPIASRMCEGRYLSFLDVRMPGQADPGL
jgi:hypothetical protein